MLVGWSVGFAACLLGLVCSYSLDLPYGPTLVLALGGAFTCAVMVQVVAFIWRSLRTPDEPAPDVTAERA